MPATTTAPGPAVDASQAGRLTVLYDGSCGFCTRQAGLAARLAGRHRTDLVSTAVPGVREQYGLTAAGVERQMYVRDAAGRLYGGAAAVARLVRAVPVVGFVGRLYDVPALRHLADAVYRWISRHRYAISRRLGWDTTCETGACALPPHHPPAGARPTDDRG